MYLKAHIKSAQENLILTFYSMKSALTIIFIYFMCAEDIKNMFHFISFELEPLQVEFYAWTFLLC